MGFFPEIPLVVVTESTVAVMIGVPGARPIRDPHHVL